MSSDGGKDQWKKGWKQETIFHFENVSISAKGYKSVKRDGTEWFSKSYDGIVTECVNVAPGSKLRAPRFPFSATDADLTSTPWQGTIFKHRFFIYDDKAFNRFLAEFKELTKRIQKGKPDLIKYQDGLPITWSQLRATLKSQAKTDVPATETTTVDAQTERVLQTIKEFIEKYERFLNLVCFGDPYAKPYYNLVGCDTPTRVDGFCSLIKTHHKFWGLIKEARGRPRKPRGDIVLPLRKRHAVLMRWVKKIRAAAKRLAEDQGLTWSNIEPSAAGTIFKMTGIPDKKFIKNVLLSNKTDLDVVKDRLKKEKKFSGIPPALMERLFYSKQYDP